MYIHIFKVVYTPKGVWRMPGTSERCLAETIRSVGTSAFYKNIAGYLRNCIEHDNIIALAGQGSSSPTVQYTDFRGPNVFIRLERDYLTGGYLLDPFHQLCLNRCEPGIYRLLEIAPDQFLRSRYYNWYYGQLGITDEITVILPFGVDSTATISMGKSGASGKTFSARAKQRLKEREPIVLALLEAHWIGAKTPIAPKTEDKPLADGLISAMQDQYEVRLSKRQAEVALLILKGHSSLSAGLQLGISAQTIKVFRKQLYKKCNLSSQAELFSLMMPLLGALNES